MKKTGIVVASPQTIKAFLLKHILFLQKKYEVVLLADFSDNALKEAIIRETSCRFYHVPIRRNIALCSDITALLTLFQIFRAENFDAVYSITPKAGLLAMTAAQLSFRRHRIHSFVGQVWATRKGLSRWLFKQADRLIALMATEILIDSKTQREFLLSEGVVSEKKSRVLGHGSISGVDLERFKCTGTRDETREKLKIPRDAVVALFVGRLNREKGIPELLDAFFRLEKICPKLYLVLAGPCEESLGEAMKTRCLSSSRIRMTGFVDAPWKYMEAGDFLCLPSHREGFGSVVIEAAALGLPALASDIYGLQDAVIDGQTGILHPVNDVLRIMRGMELLTNDVNLRKKMGRQAKERVEKDFSADSSSCCFADFFQNVMKK